VRCMRLNSYELINDRNIIIALPPNIAMQAASALYDRGREL
jgi:hypothetical protein